VDTGDRLVPLSSAGGKDILVAKLKLAVGSGMQALSAAAGHPTEGGGSTPASWTEAGATRYSGGVNGVEAGWAWDWALPEAGDGRQDGSGTGGQPSSGRQDTVHALSHRHPETGNQERALSTDVLDRIFVRSRQVNWGRLPVLMGVENDAATLKERGWESVLVPANPHHRAV
jgi:hypothetical protein